MKNLQELLDFSPVQGNAPVMTCNACGRNSEVKQMATLYPFDDRSCDYSIVVCSDKCRETLLNPENKEPVTMMMAESICNISMNAGLNVNDEFHQYFQQFI